MAVGAMERPLPGATWSWAQLGGISGILMVILFVVGIIVQGDAPQVNDTPEDSLAWFVDNGDQYLVGDFLIAIAVVVFFVPFFVTLRAFLRGAGGAAEQWSTVAMIGAVFFALVGAGASMAMGGVAAGADELSADTVRLAQYVDFYAFGGLSMALVPFFLGVSLIILQGGVLWKWQGWLGLILAVVALIGAASPIEGDPEGVLSLLSFISFIGLGVFILITSAGMLMSKDASGM
jgi:hypothetical protein